MSYFPINLPRSERPERTVVVPETHGLVCKKMNKKEEVSDAIFICGIPSTSTARAVNPTVFCPNFATLMELTIQTEDIDGSCNTFK